MLRLFKNFKKKDFIYVLICIILMVFQVWIELRLPEYMSKITMLIETDGSSFNEIIHQGIFMLICAFGSMVSAMTIGYFASRLSANFSLRLRESLFKKVQKLCTAEIKQFSTSSLITRTTNDVTQIEMLIAMGLQAMIKAPIMAVWAISKIVNKSTNLSLIVGAGVLVLLTIIIIIMVRVVPKFSKIQKFTDSVNSVTRENLMGIRVIRAFNAEKFQSDRFESVNNDLTKTSLFIQKTFALMSPFMNLIMHFLTLGIYFVGAYLINSLGMVGKVNLFSNMVVFSSYGMQVIMSFLMLTLIFMILPRAQVSAKRINEVMDADISIKDGKFGLSKRVENGTVEFRDVSFKYPDADEYLLKNISFKVNKGETIAFIGSTGSGKSTLVNLIPRFYDVTDGSILVDGVDVRNYKLDALHNLIGYVSQKAVMFTGTVASNIRFGTNNAAEINDEKIKDALKVSEAFDFVSLMEYGIDAHIARGGTNVSGGQKQRLSIARAVARNPEIYIFDDTFSALDYKTDLKLRQNLKKYTKDATILVVAQRIGTVLNADKIVVLDNGECVGMGTHKELLKSCEVYRQIALSQVSKEELENA
ncbi:MAG: ABC transporter ATP-binding protein [Acholeplasmatales bacterium]|nr:ABC transporter ATP-binding protein [Acholeplasmatales bacterium]